MIQTFSEGFVVAKTCRAITSGLAYFALRDYVLAQPHPPNLLMLFTLSLFPWMIYYAVSAFVSAFGTTLVRIVERWAFAPPSRADD